MSPLRRGAAAAMVVAALSVGGVAGCGDESTPSASTSEATPSALSADQQPGDVGQLAPLVFQALRSPIPFMGSDNRTHLAYQLTIQNGGPVPVRIDRILIRDGDDPERVISSVSGSALESGLGLLASPIEPLPKATFEPSQAGAFWVDATLDEGESVPANLEHSITATPVGQSFYDGRDTVTAAPVAVADDEPVILSAPLSGRNWLDITGCCTGIPNHRHALFPAAGQLFAAQEFAIDFMRLDEHDRLSEGSKDDPSNYAAYDAPVLAVSDATVVAARDGLPDQVPGDPKPVPAEQADGNFVMLDLGDGRYANYAHLKPGSVTVKPGDEVETGEQLGRVGNSGQTETPHLHFHVMDRPLLAEAVGLPYEFERFDVQGMADVESVDRALASGAPAEVDATEAGSRQDALPLELTVLDFP